MSMLICEPFETAARFGWLLQSMRFNGRNDDVTNAELLDECALAWRGWYNVVVETAITYNDALRYVYVTVANRRFMIELLERDDDITKTIYVREVDCE